MLRKHSYTRCTVPLPNKACGLPSTEDALNLVNSRKKHGAGELITKTLHAAFFFFPPKAVRQFIWESEEQPVLPWGLNKDYSLVILSVVHAFDYVIYQEGN